MLIIIIVIILFICYGGYKFCKIASISDNKELEDKLFLETYIEKKTGE